MDTSSTRLWVGVSAAASVLVIALVFLAGPTTSASSDPSAEDEAASTLAAHAGPSYWLGRSYDGLHLLEANAAGDSSAALYGEQGCDPDAGFIDAFCFPDLTLETKPATQAGRPRSTCRRHVGASVVLGCASGEYGVVTGRSVVLVHVSSGSSNRAEQDRLVRALRLVQRAR